MQYKQNIVLKLLEIVDLENALLFQSFELIEFINKPSHDKYEALNFTDELICEIDVFNLLFFFITLLLVYRVLFHHIILTLLYKFFL